jgi:uncharacterized membrane protein YcaP (DUF421 family)
METLISIFGNGKDLTVWQMSARGVIIFLVALILIRISGRRSFGVRTPLDNIIVILLGALLSRAIVGASAFVPVVVSSFVIVVVHRFCAWIIVQSSVMSRIFEGNKLVLFEKGRFLEKNMDKGLVCKEDVMQGVRKSALTDDLEKIDRVFMERNGEISALKKI